jgi:uncharacterized YigZ family protein
VGKRSVGDDRGKQGGFGGLGRDGGECAEGCGETAEVIKTRVLTITNNFSREEVIERSRFICTLTRTHSEEEARDCIAALKKEHYRANHNCSAYILGYTQDIQHSSDDGEPSGTAGMPMLEVLRKRGVTNVTAVVTRYFGGIKLGAGGLIREYAGSVARALDEAVLAQIVTQQEIILRLPYSDFDSVQRFLKLEQVTVGNSDFAADIVLHAFIDQQQTESFCARLTDTFNGKVTVKIGKVRMVEAVLPSTHISL